MDLIDGDSAVSGAQVGQYFQQFFPGPGVRLNVKLPLTDDQGAYPSAFQRNVAAIGLNRAGKRVSLECSFEARFPLPVLDPALAVE